MSSIPRPGWSSRARVVLVRGEEVWMVRLLRRGSVFGKDAVAFAVRSVADATSS